MNRMTAPPAEPVHVLLVRHGQTGWNAEGRIQGHTDIPLDATGRWQALQLARALHDEPVAAVYSSDLQRARQTAEPLCHARGLPMMLAPELRERAFGGFEGRTFAELEVTQPDEVRRWKQRDPDWGPPGGERLSEFFSRALQALERLVQPHGGQTVLLVTHGGVLDCLHRAALSLPLQAPRTWVLGNAVVNRLLVHADGVSLLGWNDDRHLGVLASHDGRA
jgi:probable phosphoglycerate mutase